jgi:osmotically inducible protein OsmC
VATERTVEVDWIGAFLDGEGKIVSSTSGKLPELEVTWEGRTDEDAGLTSPEELLAAAHASCYSMALAAGLVGGGWEPLEIKTACTVALEVGVGVVSSKLSTRVELDGEIADDKLREVAERAKLSCPISKALAGIEITLELPDLPPPADELEEAAEAGEVGATGEE